MTSQLLDARQSPPPSLGPLRSAVRVLHLINGQHFSGAERVQDLLALRLPEFGFEVGFACLKPERFPRMRRSQTSELITAGMRHRLDWSCARRLADHVRKQDYRILHAHTPRTLVVARLVARRTGLPLVYHVHSPAGRDSTHGLKNRINQWVETRCLPSADRLICVSQSIARHMRSLGIEPDKIDVVPNGVPASDHQRSAPLGNHWTVGTVALIRPRKGIEVLLDAVAQLKKLGTSVSLLAVGPFETVRYEAEIMDRVERLGIGSQITWTGFCTDVESKLHQMDLFVLPSLFGEGLPMVVLEAMAVGLPVIASRVEGTPEAVRDGVDGLICEPGDPADLADKIRSLIERRYQWHSLGQSARQRQRALFSDASMARGVAVVYRKVLAPHKVASHSRRADSGP